MAREKNDILILTKKAVKGNANAYAALIEEYKIYLFKTAFLYTKNEDIALDAVQECITKGFISMRKLRKPEYFKTWITKILINELHHASKVQTQVIPFEELEIPQKEEELSVEEKVVLYDAIDTLQEKYKIVIILKYFHDMKVSEISNAMDIPEGSIKVYLSRAKRELKEYLKEEYRYDVR